MHITPRRVEEEQEWVHRRSNVVVPTINTVRTKLGQAFDVHVDHVSREAYRSAVDETFADGDVAVNITALVAILRDLDVVDDYPGFVVDEILGRELAATIAGGRPLSVLAEATFHYADVTVHGAAEETAGEDDLDAALAAGFQTVIAGWPWRESPSPFDRE